MIKVKANAADIFKSRPALPFDGNKGGLPELIIDPKNVTQTDFSVLKPGALPMENKYLGMTANERLWVSGLMDEFEKAVKKRCTEKVRAILKKVDLTEDSIDPILEKLGL